MSYCTHCGTQVAAGTGVCPQCGKPPGGKKPTNWPLIAIFAAAGATTWSRFR